MRIRLLSILLLTFFGIGTAFAQSAITGQVVDENSEPLIGATVSLHGGSTGTITDLNGNFSINAAVGTTLTVSYLGYDTRDVKATSANMRVIMRSNDSSLDEVVVVGVSMKKSDLTGSVGVVDSKVLTEKPVTNLSEALVGRVAGLNIVPNASPSEDPSVKVRGSNSINASTNPIYVLDGIVMDNTFGFFNSINPNDVESVQVLKDASATALYGSRGANGVIVITTKKGSQGEGRISYDGWISLSSLGNRPATMNSQQLHDLRVDAYGNGYMINNPTATAADRQAYLGSTDFTSMAFSDQELAGYNSGKTYDWVKQVTKTGVTHNHNISFSKATDKSNIYLSMNLSNMDGVVVGTTQTKYSGRINAETNIKPWLRVGTNTSYSYSKDNMPSGSVYNNALKLGNPMIDYAPYKDDATRYLDYVNTLDPNRQYLVLFWGPFDYGANNNNYNPFNSMDVQTDRSRYQLSSSNYININPIEGLNIRSTFAISRGDQSWNQFIPTGIQEAVRQYGGKNYASQQRFGSTSWNWNNTISYDTTIKELHHLNAFVGTEATRYSYNSIKSGARGFAGNELGYNAIGSGSETIINQDLPSDAIVNTLMSYVARVNYNYGYRYYVTLTGRYDGSSKFAADHKWGFFPSAALAWDVTNESFFPQQDYLTRLKVRAGYGSVGNQNIPNGVFYNTMYAPQTGGGSYANNGTLGNPDLSWEKQGQTNIGVDLGLFKNRVNISLDAFFIKNSNLLFGHNLPLTSGYNYTWENIGDLTNKGVELTVSATPVQTKDFTWNISGNLSTDNNKITKLYGGVQDMNDTGGYRNGAYIVGHPLGSFYVLKSGGIATNENRELWEGKDYNGRIIGEGDLFPLDLNGDDKIRTDKTAGDDRYIYDDVNPDLYGGFTTDLTYKGITLNAVFGYSVGGHTTSDYYENLVNSTGMSQASPDLMDRWSVDNPNGKFPRVVRNTGNSSYYPFQAWEMDQYIQSTSYLRLSTLSLAYNFNQSLLKRINVNSLRVYFTASNVFTVTGYKGVDPVVGDYNYPPERSFTFGLSFSL